MLKIKNAVVHCKFNEVNLKTNAFYASPNKDSNPINDAQPFFKKDQTAANICDKTRAIPTDPCISPFSFQITNTTQSSIPKRSMNRAP